MPFPIFVVNEVWARHHVKANDNASAPSPRWFKEEPRKEGGEAALEYTIYERVPALSPGSFDERPMRRAISVSHNYMV